MGRDKKIAAVETVEAAGPRHLQARLSASKYQALRHLALQMNMNLQGMLEMLIDQALSDPKAKGANELAGHVDDPASKYLHFRQFANPHLRVAVERIIDSYYEMEKK